MANLYSQYASGIQFTAGVFAGSSLGVSGINPVVDRLNSIAPSDDLVSGTGVEVAGNFSNLTAGAGIDVNNGSVIAGETSSTTNAGIVELATIAETQTGTDTGRAVTPDSAQAVLSPIGAIIAWAKTMASVPQTLPVGWVECDGSTISDAQSPMNGEDLPDLNGGEFLRGAATSGGTGGSDTMAHTHTGASHTHTLTHASADIGLNSTNNTIKTGFYNEEE